MAKACSAAQVTFGFEPKRSPRRGVRQPHASSDGGAVLLKSLDTQLQLTKRLAGCLVDRDTGEGIPAEDLPRVFEKFSQVGDPETQKKGSGLGAGDPAEACRAARRDDLGRECSRQGHRVLLYAPHRGARGMKQLLVVDDDPDIRQMLKVVLEAHHFAVATAANGRQAVEQVQADVPDGIFLDIRMPVMDGSARSRPFGASTRT